MLSDLTVFSDYARTALTEVLTQQLQLFNAATEGALVLTSAANVGDFTDTLIFGAVSGLVRRRNPYGTGTVAEKHLTNLTETSVKIGGGTPPVELDDAQFKWIQQNPQVAGAALGKQLARQVLSDMVNTAVNIADAALKQITALVYDNTGATVPTLTPIALSNASFNFGDRYTDIAVWIMHSKVMGDFYANALTGTNFLFQYGTVNVGRDPFGRLFIVTDAPGLVTAGSPNTYDTLGLVRGAVRIEQNNDFHDNYDERNGFENIHRTYQAEWSYNASVKGFSWDKTNGGKAPNDAALLVSTNWDRYATSLKDLAGVVLKTK
jgi:hypothetical protein